MSSNIKVQRICQHCGNEFTARTTVTQYCGDDCAKKAYKLRIRESKIKTSDAETIKVKAKPIEDLRTKEFLTISEACQLLSVSRWTVWRSIKNNGLKAGSIGRRKLIKRSEIEKLLGE